MSNEVDQHISEGRDIHNRTVETDGWKIEDGKQISSLLPFHSVHDLSFDTPTVCLPLWPQPVCRWLLWHFRWSNNKYKGHEINQNCTPEMKRAEGLRQNYMQIFNSKDESYMQSRQITVSVTIDRWIVTKKAFKWSIQRKTSKCKLLKLCMFEKNKTNDKPSESYKRLCRCAVVNIMYLLQQRRRQVVII